MKLYYGVYYYIDPDTSELYIYYLDCNYTWYVLDGSAGTCNYTWYVLDASAGVWNPLDGIPFCGIENLKKY